MSPSSTLAAPARRIPLWRLAAGLVAAGLHDTVAAAWPRASFPCLNPSAAGGAAADEADAARITRASSRGGRGALGAWVGEA